VKSTRTGIVIEEVVPPANTGTIPLLVAKISHLPPAGEEIVLDIVTGMGPIPGVLLEMTSPPALKAGLMVNDAGETETLPPAVEAVTLNVTSTVWVTLPEVSRIFPI
jgi:hypothetical protein